MTAKKTQAMRFLDSKGVPYTATVYHDGGEFHSGEEAAEILGVPISDMYKTLVVLREADPKRRPMIVMVPSDSQLDLKRLASAVGEKKLRMATQKEAEALTGMQVGGISVLGLRKPGFDVLIDERARGLETIHISAGERGVEISMRAADLVEISGAQYVAAS